MIDLNQLKEKELQLRQAILSKRIDLDFDRLLFLTEHVERQKLQVDLLRQTRNTLSEQIAKNTGTRNELVEKSKLNNKDLVEAETVLRNYENERQGLEAMLPGIPHAAVPQGETDADNTERHKWGTPKPPDLTPRDHLQLAEMHGLVEFEAARAMSGSRAYALVGDGALLEMAVMRFAFDHILAKGFQAILPPLMVRTEAMFGTGYFPFGEENAYELTKDGLYLTGTSEVGIVALHAGKTIDLADLPKRMVGISTCFRREAGSAGRDTRGLYRMHQFQKVEQVVFCEADPALAQEQHDLLLQNAEEILQALELPYRVMECCSGELGLGQTRKYDIETWMPGRTNYGETHSCSNFEDFQARRLNIRYRDESGKKKLVYTLNNTAIASPRILIALLENHQDLQGRIYIPPVLRPYLTGRTHLETAST
mgnify:CR=1 FL=1